MTEKKSTKAAKASGKPAAKPSTGFSPEERAAMKERAHELKNEKRGADGEKDVLAVIAATPEAERALCTRLHKIIRGAAPDLLPKTWYGMPAYTNADGKVVCFFKPACKFKDRYLTLGFNDVAKLDDGSMWPTAFALTKLTAREERQLAALVKKAVG